MSSRLRLPRCRKFPPRISQEDLKAQTTEVMKEKGANYHFQAQFYEATSHEVVGSKNPKFCTLQPSPKIKDEEDPWAQSYDFVMTYLKKNGMDLTLSAMNVEFGKKKPTNTDIFDQEDLLDQFFEDLIDQSKNMKNNTFKKCVSDFARREGFDE
ncbi:hypothetical protein TRFO_40107 [Tritrichomonas foetus]|uniref:Uncharacterized protein n=1 Tax=Tritrichomonas foetus TaxID=1144522 RepID=A0A1J4J7G4_9EUKA|nr:hypothetical protein TRFO_40107 [Tritrichomonas foetus]|eukprot:OHS93603.1 hypothetical protein TRFO_40107 [Tritrichomonas foetus]